MNNKILEILIKNKPSPILLIETRYSDVNKIIFNFIKSLNCENSIESCCNNCKGCKKIDSHSYYDMYIINDNNQGILKDEVLKIITVLSASSLESKGNKFLIIYGIETANKFVVNSLLKSIENPPKNTYFIFVTRNNQQVVQTIISRCETFKILPELDNVIKKLIESNIDSNYHDDLINVYFNHKEMIDSFNDGTFFNLKEISNKINISSNNYALQKKILEEFKKLDYSQIIYLINLISYKRENHIKEKIFNLISICKFNINKTLIFNELLNIIF